ncbi:hypothetical protein [Gloeocapsopsis dulcis]|uniref:hypothetical protein n=1 Tax=Gloeocapsopsis dulcis TaxID=2859516 RepID=UPI0018C6F5CC|nr:hypothetical protein [Gloeocapsopsis dulcis]
MNSYEACTITFKIATVIEHAYPTNNQLGKQISRSAELYNFGRKIASIQNSTNTITGSS